MHIYGSVFTPISFWVSCGCTKCLRVLNYVESAATYVQMCELASQIGPISVTCLKIIDRKLHPGASADELCQVYNHSSLEDRRKKHLLAVMYRHAQKNFNLEHQRPKIQLRNRGKIEFKVPYTTLTMVQHSPFYRGAKLWVARGCSKSHYQDQV